MAMLVNESTGVTVVPRVELAVTRSERRRGLLGRDRLSPTSALVLSPCWAIHTAFMRFRIDVVFVDAHGRVVHVVRDMRPWRIAMSARAHVVIELAAGTARQRDINVGDRVTLVQTAHERPAPAERQALPLERRAC
jgi:uncharacterized membrane protein (UPF0127 family)